MARTRSEIQDLVSLHTGYSTTAKGTLMDALCDSALKLAIMKHSFRDSISTPDDFTIDEDSTSVDIESVSNLIHIVTARIVEADGSRNKVLKMKNRTWWDRHVINPEDNQKGWPNFGLRYGTKVYLDRPANSGLELRLRVSTSQSFADDDTECPVDVLELFVEKYVTAGVFLSVENPQSYLFWKSEALGPLYDRGIVGGELLNAINADKFDTSEELQIERDDIGLRDRGIAVENLITGHDRYGETDTWY